MKAYAKAQGTAPVLVASVGDNFYAAGMESNADWTNMWSSVYGPNDTTSGLHNVPWYSVLGNHDMGNDDATCACGTCKQMDSYPGRPEEASLYNMPDYNWYKAFPSAGLEVIGVESNTYDDNNLGGNGWGGGSSKVPEACGMTVDQVKQFLRSKYEQGLALVKERARKTTARTVLIIQHYPKYSNIPQELVAAFKENNNNNATIISAYGHDHNQRCEEGPESRCEHILSGGGGGYGPAGLFGFVAVHLDGMGGYSTKITDPDVTVKPNECAVCEPWMDCLWATNSSRSLEIIPTWYYVVAAVLTLAVAAVAVAFALRCRARQNANERAAEASPSTALRQMQSDA
jgi:hypothetical protein